MGRVTGSRRMLGEFAATLSRTELGSLYSVEPRPSRITNRRVTHDGQRQAGEGSWKRWATRHDVIRQPRVESPPQEMMVDG